MYDDHPRDPWGDPGIPMGVPLDRPGLQFNCIALPFSGLGEASIPILHARLEEGRLCFTRRASWEFPLLGLWLLH